MLQFMSMMLLHEGVMVTDTNAALKQVGFGHSCHTVACLIMRRLSTTEHHCCQIQFTNKCTHKFNGHGSQLGSQSLHYVVAGHLSCCKTCG